MMKEGKPKPGRVAHKKTLEDRKKQEQAAGESVEMEVAYRQRQEAFWKQSLIKRHQAMLTRRRAAHN